MTNHEGHIKLWDELAKSGGKSDDKYSVFNTLFHADDVCGNACYACIEASHGYNKEWDEHYPKCDTCPVDWGVKTKVYPCEAQGSPYFLWRLSNNKKERKRLAALIRDLPWKEAECV